MSAPMTCADCTEKRDNFCPLWTVMVDDQSPTCGAYTPKDEAAPDPTEDVAPL